MTTIECTVSEFNAAFVRFNDEIGNKNNSQDSIGNLWKGLVLHYLGMQDATDGDVERSAIFLNVAHHGGNIPRMGFNGT